MKNTMKPESQEQNQGSEWIQGPAKCILMQNNNAAKKIIDLVWQQKKLLENGKIAGLKDFLYYAVTGEGEQCQDCFAFFISKSKLKQHINLKCTVELGNNIRREPMKLSKYEGDYFCYFCDQLEKGTKPQVIDHMLDSHTSEELQLFGIHLKQQEAHRNIVKQNLHKKKKPKQGDDNFGVHVLNILPIPDQNGNFQQQILTNDDLNINSDDQTLQQYQKDSGSICEQAQQIFIDINDDDDDIECEFENDRDVELTINYCKNGQVYFKKEFLYIAATQKLELLSTAVITKNKTNETNLEQKITTQNANSNKCQSQIPEQLEIPLDISSKKLSEAQVQSNNINNDLIKVQTKEVDELVGKARESKIAHSKWMNQYEIIPEKQVGDWYLYRQSVIKMRQNPQLAIDMLNIYNQTLNAIKNETQGTAPLKCKVWHANDVVAVAMQLPEGSLMIGDICKKKNKERYDKIKSLQEIIILLTQTCQLKKISMQHVYYSKKFQKWTFVNWSQVSFYSDMENPDTTISSQQCRRMMNYDKQDIKDWQSKYAFVLLVADVNQYIDLDGNVDFQNLVSNFCILDNEKQVIEEPANMQTYQGEDRIQDGIFDQFIRNISKMILEPSQFQEQLTTMKMFSKQFNPAGKYGQNHKVALRALPQNADFFSQSIKKRDFKAEQKAQQKINASAGSESETFGVFSNLRETIVRNQEQTICEESMINFKIQ